MRVAVTSAAVAAALLVASAPAGAATRAATTVSVKASEFKFKLSTSSVARGTVKFKIKNVGRLVHDFKIAGKTSKLVNAGQSTTLSVKFSKAGNYKYVCTVDGHAKAGMKGTLRVR